jgi:hypothetical protein
LYKKREDKKMYKIRISTKNFKYRKSNNLSDEISNDTCKALDGKKWEYKTEKGLLNRLNFLLGYNSTIKPYSKSNLITIKGTLYEKRQIPIKLPGMCSGFIDLREVVNIVKRDGKFKIPKIVIL